jgi:GH43 family beta-xylosidase
MQSRFEEFPRAAILHKRNSDDYRMASALPQSAPFRCAHARGLEGLRLADPRACRRLRERRNCSKSLLMAKGKLKDRQRKQ